MTFRAFSISIHLAAISIFSLVAHDISSTPSPLVAVIMMMKNEAPVIEDTLRPYLQAGIKDFLMLDTGSTDDTIAIARRMFEEYGATGAIILERPFVDYATSRNHAIELAEEYISDAAFYLMIDAEWYLRNVEGLLEFCQENIDHSEPAFIVRLKNEWMKNDTVRLFRPHRGIRYVGAVHECLNRVAFVSVPETTYFYYNPSRFGAEKSRNRWKKDRNILLKEYEKNPNDPRTTFYLAQTNAWLEDYQQAVYWFKIRCGQDGWDQETYVAWYGLADAYEHLNDWPKALLTYLHAYSLRPKRVDPLVRIAQHYLQENNYSLAFLFAHQAVRIPDLEDENLFINSYMYQFVRYDVLGIIAGYVGEYEIGENAVRKAMLVHPEAPHLKHNLSLYENRKITA